MRTKVILDLQTSLLTIGGGLLFGHSLLLTVRHLDLSLREFDKNIPIPDFDNYQLDDDVINPFDMDLNLPPVPELMGSLDTQLSGKR